MNKAADKKTSPQTIPTECDGRAITGAVLREIILGESVLKGAYVPPSARALDAMGKAVTTLQYRCRLATLGEVARRWLALDVDSLPAPEGLDRYDLPACARVALAALPEAFHGAAAIVQATASHTIKPGLRLRLWCWLARPVSAAELKRWLRAVPVDASVFAAAQPIYTAAPLFVGCADPLAARLALMPGAAEVLPPSPETLAPPPRPPAKPLKMRAASAGKYARRALERATERILGASARHPVILSEARGLARLVAAGLLPERDMREVIHAAAAAVGKTDTTEIDQLIAWAASRPSGTSPEAERG